MPDTSTPNYGLVKPEISGSPDTWGNKWNTNADTLDTQLKAVADARLPLAGGSMTGNIVMGAYFVTMTANPTDPTHAARKSYVDSQDAATLASAHSYADAADDVLQAAIDALSTNLTTNYMPKAGGAFTGGVTGTTLSMSGNITGSAIIQGGSMTVSSAAPTISMTDTGWGTRYIVADGGVIGFQSSASAWSLQVDNSGNVTAAANISAYSDVRLKDHVDTIKDALGIVLALRGVRYIRKDSGAKRVGVIAQEVVGPLPEVVFETPDGIMAVNYGDIVGVLIEAVKELTYRVESLENAR